MSNTYLDRYKQAMADGREIDCYNNSIPFCDRDTFIIGLTDMSVLWRKCIIPLICEEGDLDLPNRIHKYVIELLKSNNVVHIFCALACINEHKIRNIFKNYNINIDFSDCEELAKTAVITNADKIKNYQGNEFCSYGNPFEMMLSLAGLDKKDFV